MKIMLSGLSIELGEQEKDYKEIPKLESLIEKYRLIDLPDYWGWGKYRKTEGSCYSLGLKAGEKALERSGLDRNAVDAIIYCNGGTGEPYHIVNEKMGALICDLKIFNADLLSQCFMGCVSVFSAIKMARNLLANKIYKNILIVTTDKIGENVNRFREFGIYSDSASSFILSTELEEGYEILNVVSGSDYKLMNGIMENKDSHFQNLNRIHSGLFSKLNLEISEFRKIFITNLYKPLLGINMVRLGYKPEQSFYENIAQVGHCFSSDPFVNLVTYQNNLDENDEESSSLFVIGAMAKGHAGFCALKLIEEYDTLLI